jgi:hypothetical protein
VHGVGWQSDGLVIGLSSHGLAWLRFPWAGLAIDGLIMSWGAYGLGWSWVGMVVGCVGIGVGFAWTGHAIDCWLRSGVAMG